MNKDILLLTIDCWRTDTLDRMPRFKKTSERKGLTEDCILCQSSATSGVLAGFLASQYPPQAYSEKGTTRESVRSIASKLGSIGYKTGAVIGSNPYPNLWANDFDFFWNDGLSDREENSSNKILEKNLYHKYNLHRIKYLLLQQKVSAKKVASVAERWYNNQDDPVFLWIHLNDIHEPYLPGLSRGMDVGLLNTYRAYIAHERRRESMSETMLNIHRELYSKSVDLLDSRLPRILNIVDENSNIIIMGDHGQEFEHGIHMHARMYDEVIQVPLFIRWSFDNDQDLNLENARQIDIPPTILQSLGRDRPQRWEGNPLQKSRPQSSFSIGHSPYLGKTFTAIREDEKKLIKNFDLDTGEGLSKEYYNIAEDPDETNDKYGTVKEIKELENKLDDWLARDDIRLTNLETRPDLAVSASTDHDEDPDNRVSNRLRELGYLE